MGFLQSIKSVLNILATNHHFKKESLDFYMNQFLHSLSLVEMTIGVVDDDQFIVYNLHHIEGLFIQKVKVAELSDWELPLKNNYYIEEQNNELNEFARIYGYFDEENWIGFIRFVRAEKALEQEESYQLIKGFFEIFFLEKTKKELVEKMEKVEMKEPMTGLGNRLAFVQHLSEKIQKPTPFSFLRIKVDGLRKINDIVGFTVGDEILKRFANRLEAIQGVQAFRISGTEFTVIIENASDEQYVIRRVIEAAEEPIKYVRHRLKIDIFLGVVRYPENGRTLEELEFSSVVSLEHSKLNGKNKVGYFVEELKRIREEQDYLEEALEKAIDHDEIDVYYQAQFSLKENKIVGLEALARWEYNGKMIPPYKFIPIAEATGMILELGYSVFRKVCHFQKKLEEKGHHHITIAVNISVAQLIDEDFLSRIQRMVEQNDIDTSRIELEITESISLEEQQGIARKIEELKKMGFKIVMDDFGTGYASMTYLKGDIYHKIKVDRYFIKDIGISENDDTKEKALLQSIVQLVQSLGMLVLVEGVETKEQLDFLENMGCDYMQGFLYSKPIKAEKMLHFIQEREKESS